ncbi:hypothetical protein EDC96DRAFT_564850 [Choanephora cucurbitarum]|nr:hypothetical protein EDC96DRAFT_564850 [Choanephora cucurbitarum]
MLKQVFTQISQCSTRVTPFALQPSQIAPPLENKLKLSLSRHDTLLSQFDDNSLNPAEITQASKKLAQLTQPKSLFDDWIQHRHDLTELYSRLSTNQQEDDEDMVEMAKEEFTDIIGRIHQLEKDLISELAPKDEADDASAILEIRACAGGDEASIFSADMARLAKSDETGNKGFKDITVNIGGRNVFGLLKYESGVHRVQRVSATEAQCRIHTSTVIIDILPQPAEVDVQIKNSDLKIDVYRASGAGGQHLNTTDSAVRDPYPNRPGCSHLNALKVLRAKIYEQERLKKQTERRDSRNAQIGSGDSSEKIRTYNYPQNRVTDHRINLTFYELKLSSMTCIRFSPAIMVCPGAIVCVCTPI